VTDMDGARRELTKLARFMTRWLDGNGLGEWRVIVQLERTASNRYISRNKRGCLRMVDKATGRRCRRLLEYGAGFEDENEALEHLLRNCWKRLGVSSVAELAVRWAVEGEKTVMRDWFDAKERW